MRTRAFRSVSRLSSSAPRQAVPAKGLVAVTAVELVREQVKATEQVQALGPEPAECGAEWGRAE